MLHHLLGGIGGGVLSRLPTLGLAAPAGLGVSALAMPAWGMPVAVLVGTGLLLTRVRPLAKTVIGSSIKATEKVKSLTAQAVEQAQDLYEETRAELRGRKA
ncbi:MAG TPA: hypothetical protein VEQ11_08180 [Chloroflexota bacterium]|nr:hypothetical protein [Chloroflexota bacterium]